MPLIEKLTPPIIYIIKEERSQTNDLKFYLKKTKKRRPIENQSKYKKENNKYQSRNQ